MDGVASMGAVNDYTWLVRRDRYFSQCKNCRWAQHIWRESIYVVHPASGWWERARLHPDFNHTLLCGCRYYDKLGTLLDQDDAFLTVRSWQDFINRKLRIDYIVHKGFVTFYDAGDPSFIDDIAPTLSISEIIAYRSLRPLAKAVRILCKYVRQASLLARYLRWKNFHNFRCCLRVVRQATGFDQSDSAWVRSCMLQWFHLVTMFTVDHMLAYDAHWAHSICYPAVGDEIRLPMHPPLAESAGWLWVVFRLPWGSGARREGWIHPSTVNAINFNGERNTCCVQTT